MEVIYTGLRRTPEEIAVSAVQEDVDIVGLSILSGAHNVLIPKILKLLKAGGAGDIPVIAGGIIPDGDVIKLKKAGPAENFLPGASTRDIIRWIEARMAGRKGPEGKNKRLTSQKAMC